MRSDVWTAHWEGALGAWLRGQLDARGIDAPYGRYVLSLLARPLQPADLSPDTIEGAKTWERRNKNKWGPVKIEALKRAAAVQCLTNASDEESSDIEQLVDELCLKIKEVEEVSGSRRDRASQVTRARRERRRTLSPREMARLYYAAFPALGPESTPDKLPAARTWPSRRNTLPAPPKHKSRRAPRSQPSQPRHPPHPPHSQPAQLPEWVTHPDTWDYDSQDPIQDFVKSITMDEGYGTCDNTVADEIIGSKRLYERDSDSGDTDDVLLFNDWVIEDDLCFRPKSRNEEESIAMFKARFSTMENLWATDEPIVNPNANANDEDYQELPVDLQVLLSSPSDKIFECCESPDKALPASLTASIWSNNDTNQEYESGDFTSRNEDYQPSTYGSDVGFNLYPNNSNLWQNETESYNKESMEQIYNKLQPLNLDDSEETSCAIDVNNFDFKDDKVYVTPPAQTSNRSSMLDPYSLLCYDDVLESVPAATTAIRSLTALNHNPLYSSFTEVIPKSTAGYVGDGIKKKHNRFKLDIPPIKSSPKEDDDLLTSMRTHFRPIKRESATTTQAVVSYDNGVTFPIVSDLDEVKFSRSSSGSLFLESDMEPPKQYMEYRTQGIDYARLDISPSADGSDDGGLACTDLILKFKVCQSDMSVQTEEIGAKIESLPKAIDADRTLSGCSSASSLICLDNSAHSEDKFCPILDIDSELESLQLNWIQCDKCKIDSDSWSSVPVNNQASWHPMYNSTKIWSLDDNFCKACSELQAEEKAKRKTSKKALVYKEEAAREWEELLSDITYAHHLQTDSDETATPSDIYDMAPKEITIRATDGNFIRSALMAQRRDSGEEEDKWPQAEGKGFNIVGSILKQSLNLYSAKKRGGVGGDRKRRHSAGGAGGAGKLRCPLPAPPAPSRPPRPLQPLQPLLAAVDRPLTR